MAHTLLLTSCRYSTGDQGAPGSTESVQATLQRVNETARAAAEGSTGQLPPDFPGSRLGDGQAEIQQMLDAMSNAMQGGGGEADSFVETLMHGLLSKEVLYDPLKVRCASLWATPCKFSMVSFDI